MGMGSISIWQLLILLFLFLILLFSGTVAIRSPDDSTLEKSKRLVLLLFTGWLAILSFSLAKKERNH